MAYVVSNTILLTWTTIKMNLYNPNYFVKNDIISL